MSTTSSTSESFRNQPTSDPSNFNVSFNGNKGGQGFAIYIVPSGPPNDSQNSTKKDTEAAPVRSVEVNPPQTSSENESRMPQTLNNYSSNVFQNQMNPSMSYETIPNGNVRTKGKDDVSYQRNAPTHAYDKSNMIVHWKEAKISRIDKDDVYNWSRSATAKLLELYTSEMYFERFRDRFTKKKVLWNEIAEYLNREGYTNGAALSGEQCANKFRNLKKVYIKCKNQNLHVSESARRFEYFPQLHSIFSQLSPNHEMTVIDFSRDSRTHSAFEIDHREQMDGNYQNRCLSPQQDYEYNKTGQSDFVDLSRSPTDTKPVFDELHARERNGPVNTDETDFEKEPKPRYSTSALVIRQEKVDDPIVVVTKTPPSVPSFPLPIHGLKRKLSQSDIDTEVSSEIVCVDDSDDESEERNIPVSLADGVDEIKQRVPGTENSVNSSLSYNCIALFQKHIQDRNKAFSDFMKSMIDMHQQEMKLLTTILEVIQKIDEKK